MLRPRFFTELRLEASATLSLEREPSRHIARALRMRPGDRLCLFNGTGVEAHAEVEDIRRDTVMVRVLELRKKSRESPLSITLAIALSRGDRMDTIIQKATELGVQRIRPMISERTGVRIDAARLAKKTTHWRKIAISACEQCGRNTIPELAAPCSFREVLDAGHPSDVLRLILHPGLAPEEPLPAACSDLCLLIGPEGGFSDAEVASALASGFRGLTLGPRVLRTETAPLTAVALAQTKWGDF